MIGSVWPSVGTAVFGSLLTWGLARAFGVRASFVPVLVASLVTRLLISSGSILAGGTNGYGSIGAFLVAPILGLTAEVITAQWEEDEAKPTVTPTPPERPVVQSGGQTSDWVPTVAVIRFAF